MLSNTVILNVKKPVTFDCIGVILKSSHNWIYTQALSHTLMASADCIISFTGFKDMVMSFESKIKQLALNIKHLNHSQILEPAGNAHTFVYFTALSQWQPSWVLFVFMAHEMEGTKDLDSRVGACSIGREMKRKTNRETCWWRLIWCCWGWVAWEASKEQDIKWVMFKESKEVYFPTVVEVLRPIFFVVTVLTLLLVLVWVLCCLLMISRYMENHICSNLFIEAHRIQLESI